MQNSKPTSQQKQQVPAQKHTWHIVSLKDPVLNQALQTKLKDSQRLINMDTKRFWFNIINRCSASISPGGETSGLMCTLMAAVDGQLNQIESYVVKVVSNNLSEFVQGKLNSKSAVLRGKNGEEVTIAPVSGETPQTKR